MTPRLARLLLGAALLLGLTGDLLVRDHEPRAGFALWVLLGLGVATLAFERSGERPAALRRERRLLHGAMLVLVALLVLRDAPSLALVDLFSVVVLLCLTAWHAEGRSLRQLEPRDALVGAASAVAAAVGGAPTLAFQDAESGALRQAAGRHYRSTGLGLVLAAPVLLVVTGLLASADPLFARGLDQIGTWIDGDLAGHIVFTGVATWLAAGALRGSLVPVGVRAEAWRGQLGMPFPTVAPLMMGLVLLLSAWVGLQLRVLFGGADYVLRTAGVTVASYARHGFFELIVIAGIALATLLVADDVLDRDDATARRRYFAAGQALVGLVGAVLVSAVLRLNLYLRYFGLTDDRALACAVLVWVACVLGWLAFTVLRGERGRFAPGVLALSAGWLLAVNAASPERWVVEVNLRRAERGLPFDVAYHARLSGDAVPALLAGMSRLPASDAAALRVRLGEEWTRRAAARPDWQDWSLPYRRGVRLLAAD